MRWTYFILLQCLLVGIVAGSLYIHKDRVTLVKPPPQSLAKWYKPENKRQVWLHNMFKLRREMQAIRLYAENKDAEHLEKWAGRLSEHYLKIGEMVPEWKKLLDLDTISSLEKSAQANRYEDVSKALDGLTENCESCHRDYRAVTAAIYRSPDFSSLKINGSTSFKEQMKKLTEQVNRIKIASEDGMNDVALSFLSDLKTGISLLGETCKNCHKKGEQPYPGEMISKTLTSLEQSLKSGTLKEQGRDLGTLAVLACARCHGTHRLAYDAGKTFSEKPDWVELMKH